MKPCLKDERGQAAIFMALFVSTMILLFAFTTNIGMLVHAKINLQNAADAAAYAGAAVQARQLTTVAYLNWEMRRALKEFLFYYNVRAQYAALPCYPLNILGSKYSGVDLQCPVTPGEERYDFAFYDPREGGNNETGGPFIPTTCVIFNPDNNYCQKNRVAGIPEFPGGNTSYGVADPIVIAVKSATNQIIQKKEDDCQGRTFVNQQFLINWLFNLNPIRDEFSEIWIGNDHEDPFPVAGLDRLGVLPRMAMLRARIDNLEEALNLNLANESLSPQVTEETMGTLRGLGKPLDYFERPVQAYLSAKNNLPSISEDNGNFAEVNMIELLPDSAGGVEVSPGLLNPPILAKFIDLKAKASFANSLFKPIAGLDRGNCAQFRELRTISGFPFGITKDPKVVTYYAIRLEAKARLLFSPFGGDGIVPLSAYAAAKPFGSRIGRHLNPSGEADDALKMMVARGSLGARFSLAGGGTAEPGDPLTLAWPTFPNILVTDEANAESMINGFITNSHLGYIRGAVAGIFPFRLDFGPRLAGAYAPWEVGFYTPPANYQSEIIGKFEDNPEYGGKYFSLAAPIYPVSLPGSTDLTFLRTKVNQYMFGDIVDIDTINGDAKFKEFLDAVISDTRLANLAGYINDSREKTFHYIPDPLLNDEPDLLAYVKGVPGAARYTVAAMPDPYKRQLTSWNNQKTALDADIGIEANSELGPDIGRSGYSVRFVSFDSLKRGGRATNDNLQTGVQWSNPFERLTSGGVNLARILDDINKLKH